MDDYEEDDVPRYTHGLHAAEMRLKYACENFQAHSTDRHGQLLTPVLVADIRLILRELNGLKQFDPR